MKKYKFLLKEYDKHPKGYGLMPHAESDYERLAWETMTKELKPNEKYLKHFIEEEWIDTSDQDGFYEYRSEPFPLIDKDFIECSSYNPTNIPYGVLTYYLIVYTEEETVTIRKLL